MEDENRRARGSTWCAARAAIKVPSRSMSSTEAMICVVIKGTWWWWWWLKREASVDVIDAAVVVGGVRGDRRSWLIADCDLALVSRPALWLAARVPARWLISEDLCL